MSSDYPALTDLALEVEVTPTGLVNMVQNPSGDLGGWGWVTPVANSALSWSFQYGGSLKYGAAAGVPNFFYTEALPVVAGQYVGASWIAPAATTYYRVRFEWLDAAGVVLSSTAQSGYLTGSETTVQPYGPHQAPASTASVRLRFDTYSNTSGASGLGMFVREVTVAKAAVSGDLGATRTNLFLNPSFEVNTAYWISVNCSLARITSQHQSGAASAQLTTSSAGDIRIWGSTFDQVPGIVGSRVYTISAYVRSATLTRNARVAVDWYSDLDYLASTEGATTATSSGAWTQVSHTVTAPAAAVSARLAIKFLGCPLGEVHYVDSLMVEQASTVGSYFDGSTTDADGWDYSWSGTANDSASTAITSNLGFIEPVEYANIIGPTGELKVERAELNVSTLEATIEDAALDPSQDDLIRPGKRIRLTAAGETIYTGKLLGAQVAYNPLKGTARIVLSAADNATQLAQATRPQGVGTIEDLPHVLEGAGVPWNINGSGNQVASPTVVTTNESAKAIDQVAITRDSNLGYAWVDRFGVLQVWDRDEIPADPAGSLDEDDYTSDLDVSFDVDRCINEVTIKHLRVNLATGETVEVPYGPYRDEESISEWGAHSAEFTVQGLTDDDATMAAFAAEVFAANATPQVRINAISIPIRTAADLVAAKGLLDLYDLLTVTNANSELDQSARVTSLTHEISPGRWLVRVGFSVEGGVAAPQETPPVQNAPPTSSDTAKSWQVLQSSTVSRTNATYALLPDLSVEVNPASVETVYLVTIDVDVQITVAATVNIVELVIDGTGLTTPAINTQGPNGMRVGGSKTFRVTGLSPGLHTFTARTRNTAGGTGANVTSHGVLTVERET